MLDKTVAITGASGFIGQNLSVRLREAGYTVRALTRAADPDAWVRELEGVSTVFHLAGVNRPSHQDEFMSGNSDFSKRLADVLASLPECPLVVFASSVKAIDDTPYGTSKRAAENALLALGKRVAVYRLPNVFGKWARPNYNSAIATFCWNIARQLPIVVHDPETPLSLIYIDDLIDQWLEVVETRLFKPGFNAANVVYDTTVGQVAAIIESFQDGRESGRVEEVGQGLTRALYATYVAALPTDSFSYPLEAHEDTRGVFAEMLKTPAAGQFSFFTAHPGITRGGHYHHTKTEKFLVVQGEARFRFKHILSGETHEVLTKGDVPVVVETVPGWTHDVTNIGDSQLIALLWANEVFDRARPDTIARALA